MCASPHMLFEAERRADSRNLWTGREGRGGALPLMMPRLSPVSRGRLRVTEVSQPGPPSSGISCNIWPGSGRYFAIRGDTWAHEILIRRKNQGHP